MTTTVRQSASTQVSAIIKAPRPAVYRACLDPAVLAVWRVPDAMEGHMRVFDARAGGRYRMSLSYKDPAQSPGGKTSESTDTFEGRFVELVPDEKIVEVVEFESQDSSYSGQMMAQLMQTLGERGGPLRRRF